MQLVRPTLSEATAGLRALKVLLTSDGVLSPIEERMLAATQRYLLHTDLDIERLAPITPAELAAAMPRQAVREQFASAMVIHAFTSGEADPRYVEHIERFSAALGVRAREVDSLALWVKGRLALLRFDVIRHMYIGDGLSKLYQDAGFQGILKALGGFLGVRQEPDVAARYEALGQLPEGTLGRTLYHHYRSNGYAFPGEPHGAPEMIVIHDLAHVLGGYHTDTSGELEVAAFSAGFRREDAWSIMLFVLCQFDLGIQVAPVADAEIGNLDPDRFLSAFTRGAAMTVDLFDGWDPWPVMDQPLDALRQQYGIRPKA